MEDFLTIRKEVEPLESDENNTEIFAAKVTLTCDISIMKCRPIDGSPPFWGVNLEFPPLKDHHDDSIEEDYEAIASLTYDVYGDNNRPITSLDEVLRLLGISPAAKIWESEQ